MSGRNGIATVHTWTLATVLAAGIGVGGAASAQEVIVLEAIGAVRMAQPEEARRMAAEEDAAPSPTRERPRREEREASVR